MECLCVLGCLSGWVWQCFYILCRHIVTNWAYFPRNNQPTSNVYRYTVFTCVHTSNTSVKRTRHTHTNYFVNILRTPYLQHTEATKPTPLYNADDKPGDPHGQQFVVAQYCCRVFDSNHLCEATCPGLTYRDVLYHAYNNYVSVPCCMFGSSP